MKNHAIRTLIVALVVLLAAGSALAEGQLTVVKENFYLQEGTGFFAYAYAKVENTGDENVEIKDKLLEVFDAQGGVLLSSDSARAFPGRLAPGEVGYVEAWGRIEGIESLDEVADYRLSMTGESTTRTVPERYPVKAYYEENVEDYPFTYNFATAEFTNPTDETLFRLSLFLVVLDDEDNILEMRGEELMKIFWFGVNPGSTITWRDEITDGVLAMWARAGVAPTRVEGFALGYSFS